MLGMTLTLLIVTGIVIYGVSMVLLVAWMLGAIRAEATNDNDPLPDFADDETGEEHPAVDELCDELTEEELAYMRWWTKSLNWPASQK